MATRRISVRIAVRAQSLMTSGLYRGAHHVTCMFFAWVFPVEISKRVVIRTTFCGHDFGNPIIHICIYSTRFVAVPKPAHGTIVLLLFLASKTRDQGPATSDLIFLNICFFQQHTD